MIWNKERIVKELRRRHKAGGELSYNAVARKAQSLVSAASYHFGSYRAAIEAAGMSYKDVMRRPKWDKATIIKILKKARRDGEDLSWSAVTRRRDELGRAAFASLQDRLFGRWDRALQAAGLDADELSAYRRWSRDSIVFELRQRHQDGEAINSGAMQSEDAGLHAAAVRHFGSYDAGLRAARIDPDKVRRRRTWTKATVASALAKRTAAGNPNEDARLRRDDPVLRLAAMRLFGSLAKARRAAGK